MAICLKSDADTGYAYSKHAAIEPLARPSPAREHNRNDKVSLDPLADC
jgi:hypothetical protein